MQWTHEKPTQPGFYWLHQPGIYEICVVQIYTNAGRVAFPGSDIDEALIDIDPRSFWAGPLEHPPLDPMAVRVPVPQTVDEAQAMAIVSTSYLKEHAPHLLK